MVTRRELQIVQVDSPLLLAIVQCSRWASRILLQRRGLAALDRWSKSILPPQYRDITLQLLPDALFTYPLGDNYWSFYLLEGRTYEPELDIFLRCIADINYTFIDGGANYGYWSVLVGSQPFGSKKAIAVEMSPTTLSALRKNQRVNDFRFDVIEAAITAESGGQVQFSEAEYHSRRSLADPISDTDSQLLSAATVTVDDIVDQGGVDGGVVVKLDIEGLEPEVIAASRVIREHPNLVLIAEDHYKDRLSTTVRTCLDVGLAVLFVESEGRLTPICSASMANAVKVRPGHGYNFLAYSPTAQGSLPKFLQAAAARGHLI